MPSLQELLESDLDGSTKTAAAAATHNDLDGMDKIAMQLGLLGVGTEKKAEEEGKKDDEGKKDEKKDDDGDDAGEKSAALGSGGDLHSLLFPESDLSGSAEKTAEEKRAAAEEAMGARAYDQFSRVVDQFVEKLASEVISGNPHGDSQPNNRLPNNKPGDASQAIDTKPVVTDNVKAKNDASTVGHFEQKTAAAQALRKHFILSALAK